MIVALTLPASAASALPSRRELPRPNGIGQEPRMPRTSLAFLLASTVLAVAALGPRPVAAAAMKASFDCRKAKTDIEKEICGVPEYAALDRDIATLFAKALKALSASEVGKLKADQVKWLGERNDCIDFVHGDPAIFWEVDQCLEKQLKARAAALKAILADGRLP
jgi:uncharacterized protein YecT (DUF1311 family)